MSYNTDHLRTAGKITVYTSIIGVFVFAVAFIFNLGVQDVNQAEAQSSATTTVTVLNTPPVWTATTTEETESSSNNPTNAGDEVAWVAIGTDSNSEDYYLLICSTSAVASATSGGAPHCNGGVQWAVSTATISGTQARAATTTTASTTPFGGEVFTWYSWICDGNGVSPRCNSVSTQGINATNSSPFEVNHRPTFTTFWDNSPKDPGQVVTFYSTSSDPDESGTEDTVKLIVCATAGFNTVTDTCTGLTLASSTVYVSQDATSTYTIVIPTQDNDYAAYGYVIDSHGFEASGGAHNTDSTLSVNNVAPSVSSSTISLNGGLDMSLSVESGQTTGFTLQFSATDNNSCFNSASSSEMRTFAVSIYRNGTGLVNSASTTCSPTAGPYNANRCYYSGLATTTWNLSCTASTTVCVAASNVTQAWNCTFPLWYIADPTDGTATSTQYSTNDWRAQVIVADDGLEMDFNTATSSPAESAIGVNVNSFLAFALNTLSIPYGSLEPGSLTDPIVATTTIAATGNVGLDKRVTGEAMCPTYSGSSLCNNSASSTIPESEQVFATTTVSYGTATSSGWTLSSTTPKEIEINVPKSTATSSQATNNAYWGIRVPSTISLAGDYTGENTFIAIVGEQTNW